MYNFATKWAGLAIGIGAVFVTIGLTLYAKWSAISGAASPGYVSLFYTIELDFFFCGALFIAIGVSILLMRNRKPKEITLLENVLD